LGPVVLDLFIAAGLCLLAGQMLAVSPVPVLVALCAVLLIAAHRFSHWQLAVCVLCAALGGWRASRSLARFDHARAVARELLGPPARCSGTAVVRTSPMRLRDSFAVLVQADQMECDGEGQIAPGTTLRLYSPVEELARGDTCLVIASLAPVEITRNEGVDGARAACARTGATLSGGALDVRVLKRARWSAFSWLDRARAHARRRIEASYPAQASPMARALVLGESDLDEADAEAFRVSGLSHILAVSGTHIVIAVFGVVGILHGLLVRIEWVCARLEAGRVASALGIPLAWAYAEFAGSGGSVRRAALMATAALAARALARCPDGPRAFGLSLVTGALLDPLAAFDLSFGLSAAATAGLLLLSRPLTAAIRKAPRPLCWTAAPVAATLSATLLCAPWLVMLSSSLSPVSIVANVLAVPIGELISLPACLGHLLLWPVPAAERGVALLASASLLAVRTVARLGASAEWAALPFPRPGPWHLVALAVIGAWFALRRPRDRLLSIAAAAVLLVVVEAAAVRTGQPHGRLRVSFLDVGQGDSILVDFPDGRAMLVDGGGAVGSPVDPGRTVVGPMLRARRRSRLEVAVLSHPHPDHFIGLASALPGVQVGQFWDNGQGEQTNAGPVYRGLMAGLRARGVPIVRPQALCSGPMRLGGAEVHVLGPCPGLSEDAHANDNSFVLRVGLGRRAALLVGDAEYEQESRLLASRAAELRADLLKVGHHGSRTSSSAGFLDAVQPELAVISCGVRNRFGHPHPIAMGNLAARGIPVLRTDRVGGVIWETDGERVSVRTVVPEP
jgi:competence protein ComEC